MPPLPLSGIRILSLAEQYPGPYATSLLADLGADVILIERPGSGDPSRRHGGHFESLNRNKRSVAIDLKSAAGKAAFLALVDSADAVMEGFRPGVMTRLGLDAAQLRVRKPQLIYVSVSSFGQSGPLAAVAGHDLSVQGVAGLINVAPGQEAVTPLPWLPLADVASGMFAAMAVLTGLVTRQRFGGGSNTDISMLDSLVSWMVPFIVPAINHMRAAPLPPKDPGYGVFATADGRQITLSIAGEDHMWRALCGLLEINDLAALTETERVARATEVSPRLRAAIARHPADWLARELEALQIAFGPVLSLNQVPSGAQVAHRGMFVSVPRPADDATSHAAAVTAESAASGYAVPRDAIRHVLQPMMIEGMPTPLHRNAPGLGEHTAEILRECGIDPSSLASSGAQTLASTQTAAPVQTVAPTPAAA